VLTIFLLSTGWGVNGYALAVVASGAVTVGVLAFFAWHIALRLPRDAAEGPVPVRRWARYAAVMYVGSVLDGTLAYLDRFVVGAVLGPASVAVLMIVKQLQQLPTFFHQGFLLVVAPMFAAATSTEDVARRQALFHLTTDWVTRLALPLLLFLAVFAGPMLGLYGAEFRDVGVWPLLVGLATAAVNFGGGPVSNLLMMSGKEAALLRYSILSTVLTVLGYLTFIPVVGLVGASLAQFTATLYLKVAALAIARRQLDVVWASRRYLAWIASGMFAFALLLAVRAAIELDTGADQTTAAVTLGVALVGAYTVAFLGALLSGFHSDDRAVLATMAAKLRLAPRRATAGATE